MATYSLEWASHAKKLREMQTFGETFFAEFIYEIRVLWVVYIYIRTVAFKIIFYIYIFLCADQFKNRLYKKCIWSFILLYILFLLDSYLY